MTSNIKIPKISKDNNMATSGIQSLVGRKMTKTCKFLGEDVKISRLSVAQVMEIQEAASNLAEENQGLELLRKVIRMAVEGATELSDEDFAGFPMDELSKLSTEIMKFSGIGADAGK
jgi:hypothetical protein